MDNSNLFIPGHIRENLKYYSPGITEYHHLCLECGYYGLMGFTKSSYWDCKAYLNALFWGGATLIAFVIVVFNGGLIDILILMFSIYMLSSKTGGNIIENYHCPNCGAIYRVKQEGYEGI